MSLITKHLSLIGVCTLASSLYGLALHAKAETLGSHVSTVGKPEQPPPVHFRLTFRQNVPNTPIA